VRSSANGSESKIWPRVHGTVKSINNNRRSSGTRQHPAKAQGPGSAQEDAFARGEKETKVLLGASRPLRGLLPPNSRSALLKHAGRADQIQLWESGALSATEKDPFPADFALYAPATQQICRRLCFI